MILPYWLALLTIVGPIAGIVWLVHRQEKRPTVGSITHIYQKDKICPHCKTDTVWAQVEEMERFSGGERRRFGFERLFVCSLCGCEWNPSHINCCSPTVIGSKCE